MDPKFPGLMLVACTSFGAMSAAGAHQAVVPKPTPAPAVKPAVAAPAPAGAPVFPGAVAPKYASLKASDGRMKTCLDQYKANKATNGNGGMKWIQKGGGYYSACLKKLKG
jgi:hypothetical protein